MWSDVLLCSSFNNKRDKKLFNEQKDDLLPIKISDFLPIKISKSISDAFDKNMYKIIFL